MSHVSVFIPERLEGDRFKTPSDGFLKTEMHQFYENEGYLILTDFFSRKEAETLMKRAREIVSILSQGPEQAVFSTLTHVQSQDESFRRSARSIQLFYEEETYDSEGRHIPCKEKAVNKISHALHDLDPIFQTFSYQSKIKNLVKSLGYIEPKIVQSMYIFKQPLIGGEVVYHQDATFLHTEPMTTMGLWFALEDATYKNACLRAIPGGHRSPLRRRYVQENGRLVFKELDGTPFPSKEKVCLEVPQGTLVLIHGLLPHASSANRSPMTRQAYTLHLIDGTACYAKENWLQETEERPFRVFL